MLVSSRPPPPSLNRARRVGQHFGLASVHGQARNFGIDLKNSQSETMFFFYKTLQLQYLIVNVSIRESEVGTTHALLPSRNFHVTSSSTGGDEPPRTAPQPETQGSSVNSDQILIQPCPATNRSSGSRKMFGVLLH
ncbi:unnamed protein product [Fusarium graminearum]|nr:unnamed protein product [Fusarium graminearum]